MQHSRSLRVVLAIALVVNATWAYMFSLLPSVVERLYGIAPSDPLHFYFLAQHGAMFFVLALLALLALLRPQGFLLLSLILLLQYLAFFIADVALLARGVMTLKILLPEMAYFVLMCAALIRLAPLTSPKAAVPVPRKKEEGI